MKNNYVEIDYNKLMTIKEDNVIAIKYNARSMVCNIILKNDENYSFITFNVSLEKYDNSYITIEDLKKILPNWSIDIDSNDKFVLWYHKGMEYIYIDKNYYNINKNLIEFKLSIEMARAVEKVFDNIVDQ